MTALDPSGVYFLEDVSRVLRVSRRTIQRLRRHGAFPIKELEALDKRPRWSGADIQRYLDGQPGSARRPWRRSA